MVEPWAKKSLGQHWLHDIPALEAMAEGIVAGDTVLEIGPGTGTLTEVLLRKGAEVIAVEMDGSLIEPLQKKFQGQVFNIHQQSILEFNLTTLPEGYKIVANIPYYLTSNLVRILSESAHPPVEATLLVQKEVAQRIAAAPGAMSLLSVSAQFYWEVDLGMLVPAWLFTPPPKVDSQIIHLKKRTQPLFSDIQPTDYFRVVKAGFGERRKTLSNSLSGGLRLDKSVVQQKLQEIDIEPGLRAQALTLEDWRNVAQAFNT